MLAFIRTWPALSALGAGLVHLAVASSSAMWMAVVLIVIGLAELSWAITALTLQKAPLPRLSLAVAVLPIAFAAGWALTSTAAHHSGMAMGAGPSTASVSVPLALACCLDLVMAFACASAVRLRNRQHRVARPVLARTEPGGAALGTAQTGTGAIRALAGILLGAVLVAGVTVPALGATDAGRHAGMHMQM